MAYQPIYGSREEQGHNLMTWMENANAPGCTTKRSRVEVWRKIKDIGWVINTRVPSESKPLTERKAKLDALGVTFTPGPYTKYFSMHSEADWGEHFGDQDQFQGVTVPEAIYIELVSRECKEGFFASEVSLAVYSKDNDIDTLRHIFFLNVINRRTTLFLERLELPKNQLVAWDPIRNPREFKAVLGTPLGKVAANMVLGAWDRGTHRIARIAADDKDPGLVMRFDIEEICSGGGGGGGQEGNGDMFR